jgi:hypothetical protein
VGREVVAFVAAFLWVAMTMAIYIYSQKDEMKKINN